MAEWSCVLTLNQAREVAGGSPETLAAAIGRGADLRIGTRFVHNEHIDVTSANAEAVDEVAEFGVTYLVGGGWSAGIMSLRQPVDLPVGFGPRPSMSFFLYNQDGRQAIARPFLDGQVATGERGPGVPDPPPGMPRYHAFDNWDAGTNAPSHNFVYDFDVFRYCVRDDWQELLAHDAQGRVQAGSLAALVEAFRSGAALKVGVSGLCADLGEGEAVGHEVFVQTGSAYYYTEQELLIAGSHPVVRVRPARPLAYASGNWDFGWLVLRSDGRVVYRRCDPYTLQFSDRILQLPVRWFAR